MAMSQARLVQLYVAAGLWRRDEGVNNELIVDDFLVDKVSQMCIDTCIDMCVDMCLDMCLDMCSGICVFIYTGMCAGM